MYDWEAKRRDLMPGTSCSRSAVGSPPKNRVRPSSARASGFFPEANGGGRPRRAQFYKPHQLRGLALSWRGPLIRACPWRLLILRWAAHPLHPEGRLPSVLAVLHEHQQLVELPLQWSVAGAVGLQIRHLRCVELVVLAHESKANGVALDRPCRSSRLLCVVE